MDGIEVPPHGRGGIFDVARQDRRDDRAALREAQVALGRLSRAAPLTPNHRSAHDFERLEQMDDSFLWVAVAIA